ncbi:MAG: VWA domain-containing protein [Muribaculaceae bacterium]|nr:VWA domain-containing protein [Muribaculaceae bacterium]
MRRLPVYFLVDVSESMVGQPIEQVQDGMRTIIQSLRVDPYALETVWVSIIAFAGKARCLVPLTELYKFYPPVFPIGGGTSLARGLEMLMDDIDRNVQKTTREIKGDWKPIIFIFTDGNPTDDCTAAFRRWNEKYRSHCNLVAVSIGDNVNVLTLAQITDEILLLKETDTESFSKFFKWVTASIANTSVSVAEQDGDGLKLAPTAGINLDKVDAEEIRREGRGKETGAHQADDNYVVIHGRCCNTKSHYLVKYVRAELLNRRLPEGAKYGILDAYPIDGESYEQLSSGESAQINSSLLRGTSSCPCCGNELSVVTCGNCGRLMCAAFEVSNKCPWCGEEGTLSSGGGSFDLGRGLG